jgi:hypothetical protein
MERALDELLARGLVSIRWAAQEANVPESTLRRWLGAGHFFRAEYDRRLRLRRELCDAAIATAKDPKSSPWTRLQAIRKAEELMEPPKHPEELRDDALIAALKQGLNPWTRLASAGGEPGDEGRGTGR